MKKPTPAATIAVDVAKSAFEIAVSNRPGRVAARHRVARGGMSRFVAKQRPRPFCSRRAARRASGLASQQARSLRLGCRHQRDRLRFDAQRCLNQPADNHSGP